jgi:amino acid transporter
MPPPATHPLAAGRLGAPALIFVALAAATPLSVVTTTIPIAYAGNDVPFVPLLFPAVAVVLLLFSVGYAAMVRRSPNAGALYSFIARGLGRPTGIGAGWLALLSYNALQIGLYGAAGLLAAPMLDSWFGLSAPWWTVAAGCWLIVTLGGLLRVELVGAVLALVVLAEVAVIAGFGAANLIEPAGDRISTDTLVPAGPVDRPALGLLLVVTAFGFVGFETAAAYAEEASRPRRSVARAAALSIAGLALLYCFSAWTTSVAAGPDRIAARSLDGGELLFELIGDRLAPWAVTLGRVMLLTGLVAAMISLHHTVARYTFALAREGVLPSRLGRTGARTSVPFTASITQSLVALVALSLAHLAGWEPYTELYPWLTTAGALGVLLLLFAAALSTMLFLNRAPNNEGAWRAFVAPVLATVLLGALLYLTAANLPALLGVPSRHWLVIAVPAAFALVVTLGVLFGLVLKSRSPITYAGIGLGGTAVVVAPAVPQQRSPGAHRPERIQRSA